MSITSVFNRGLDGMNVASRALGVTSNNIANINTKGYARQEIQIGSRATNSRVPGQGGGVEVLGVESITSPFIEMQLFGISNSYGTYDSRRQTVGQIESIWADSQTNGIGKSLNEFFGSFQELNNNPTLPGLRETVKEKANILTDQFNSMSRQFNQMRLDVSSEISTRLTTINSLASDIAQLNQAIVNGGGVAVNGDTIARRQDLLRQLSEEVNISYNQNSNGGVEVRVAGGASLVSGFNAGSLSFTDNQNYGGTASITLTLPGGTGSIDVTAGINGGRLYGNLYDRNTTLNNQISSIDTLAYQLATQFNAVHSTGYGIDSSTGNNFFAALASANGAAGSIAVDAQIKANTAKISIAEQDPTVSGKGDNRIGMQLAALQNSMTMSSSTQTFAQYFQGLVGSAGTMSASVQKQAATQASLLNQVQLQRESVSGVNMDEEGANIIRYQKAFQASSKMLQIADQLLDDLLRI
ncbi:MAG: flagellar hook-associated protein FlgK [Deltaproteobacteria bacterium]|nr:flagellar hook-associated protein FlgK [Deltaproteobacteria bacterium]